MCCSGASTLQILFTGHRLKPSKNASMHSEQRSGWGSSLTGVKDMSKKSRDKGAAFERWCANTLTEELGLDQPLRRNLSQYQQNDLPDLVLPPFAIECKAYQTNGAGTWFQQDWWRQVLAAAGDELMPCLMFKYDRHKPRIVLPLGAIGVQWVNTGSALYPFVADWEHGVAVIRECMHAGA